MEKYYRFEEKSRVFMDDCPSRYAATQMAPWARHYARVEGGYIAFRTGADYALWRNQR